MSVQMCIFRYNGLLRCNATWWKSTNIPPKINKATGRNTSENHALKLTDIRTSDLIQLPLSTLIPYKKRDKTYYTHTVRVALGC
jgi:hypothetical protein